MKEKILIGKIEKEGRRKGGKEGKGGETGRG